MASCRGVAALGSGLKAMKQGALRDALQRFRAAAQEAPDLAEAHLARGEAAEDLGEYDEALAAYQAAARLAPSTTTHLHVGEMANRIGKLDVALGALQHAYGSPGEHRLVSVKAGALAAAACLAKHWPSVAAMWADCPGFTVATARKALRTSRETVPQYVFAILVEAGRRDQALALARRRGWLRAGVDYCQPTSLPISTETATLLAMMTQPDRADCLVDVGAQVADDGLVRLGRQMLLDRVQHSRDRTARSRAEYVLRYLVPPHEVAKLAESLNVTGYRLHHRFRRPSEAFAAYRKAIAADPAFSWPYHNIARLSLEQHHDAEALAWAGKAIEVNPNHWRAYRTYGAAAYGLKRYGEALTAFRRAVQINPADAISQADLGRTLLKLGQETEALRALQIAVQFDPSLEEERNFVNARAGRDARRGPTPMATPEPRQRAALDPANALERAQAAFNAGRYAEALEEARRAAEAAPGSLAALTTRAGVAEFMGEFDEAQASYAKASALAPADPAVLYRRASFAVRTGDYDGALRFLDRVLAAQPRQTRWLFLRAPTAAQPWVLRANPTLEQVVQVEIDILMEKGDLGAARKLARDYAIVRPSQSYCAQARERTPNQSQEVIFQAFRLAALGDPGDADCVWWYGQWLTDEGYVRFGRLMVMEAARVTGSQSNRDSAARYVRIRLGGGRDVPKRAEQLFLIARQRYLRDGDTEGAARLFDEAMRLAPGFVRPYSYRARIAWEEGDRAGAVAWLERALQADGDSWRTHRTLGRMLEGLGRHADAEAHLRKAVELFGDDAGGRLELARVLYAEDKFEEYLAQTRAAVNFAAAWREELPEVRAFLANFERWGPGASLPPAPDPQLIIGWNYD